MIPLLNNNREQRLIIEKEGDTSHSVQPLYILSEHEFTMIWFRALTRSGLGPDLLARINFNPCNYIYHEVWNDNTYQGLYSRTH